MLDGADGGLTGPHFDQAVAVSIDGSSKPCASIAVNNCTSAAGANDVSGGKVFGEDENKITILTRHTEESWKKLSKQAVADRLVKKINDHFAHTKLVKGKSA